MKINRMAIRKFGFSYGNHIRRLIRKRIVVSACRKGAYVLNKKGSYTDSWVIVGSYLETIYTQLGSKVPWSETR